MITDKRAASIPATSPGSRWVKALRGLVRVRRFAVVALVSTTILALGTIDMPAIASAAPPLPVGVSVNAAAGTVHINEELLGLNHLTPQAAPELVPLGVNWSRIDVSFEESDANGPVYNCTTGAFDPTSLDQRVVAARAAGAQPLLLLDYTPTCLAGTVAAGKSASHNPPDIGADQAKWDQLVEEMALHEIEDENVTTFEVWNEPNLLFWNGSPEQYYSLYVDSASALEAAAHIAGRTIEVGGPALATVGPNPDVTWMANFLSYVSLHQAPLDFLSWHEYFNSPDTGAQSSFPNGFCGAVLLPDGQCDNPTLTPAILTSQINDMRYLLAWFPGLQPKLWLDEWNVNAGFDPRMSGTYGAAFAAAVLSTAQTDGLDRSAFYDAQDDSSIDNFGLLNQNGTPKPDFWTFEFWHDLAGRVLPLSVTPTLDTSPGAQETGAMASLGTNGTVQVLAYNFAPTGPVGTPSEDIDSSLTRQVTLSLSGLDCGRYEVQLRTIDTNHSGTPEWDGTINGPDATVKLPLNGQSVSLVEVTPESHPKWPPSGHSTA